MTATGAFASGPIPCFFTCGLIVGTATSVTIICDGSRATPRLRCRARPEERCVALSYRSWIHRQAACRSRTGSSMRTRGWGGAIRCRAGINLGMSFADELGRSFSRFISEVLLRAATSVPL